MVASFEDECVVPPKTSVVSSVLTHLHFHLLELLHGRHLFFGSFSVCSGALNSSEAEREKNEIVWCKFKVLKNVCARV